MVAQPITSPKSTLEGSPLASPFHDEAVKKALRQEKPFIARRVDVAWNDRQGHVELTLNGGNDPRLVILTPAMPLYAKLVKRDRVIAHLMDGANKHTRRHRELYPHISGEIERDGGRGYALVNGAQWHDVPMSLDEKAEQKRRRVFDILEYYGTKLGIAHREIDEIERLYQRGHGGLDEWSLIALRSLRALADHRKPFQISDNDYVSQGDTNVYPHSLVFHGPFRYQLGTRASCVHCTQQYGRLVEDASYTDWTLVEGTELWKCPKNHRTSDVLMRIAQNTPASTPKVEPPTPAKAPHWSDKELGLFWDNVAKAPGGFNQLGVPSAARESIVHEVIESLHTTALTRKQAEDVVLMRLKTHPNAKSNTEKTPMTATKQDWESFLSTNNLKAEEILPLLSAYSIQNEKGVVTRLSAWAFSLDTALEVVTQGVSTEAAQDTQSVPETATEKPTVPQTTLAITTLTGVNALGVSAALNRHLPPAAYRKIPYGQMSDKTDVDGDAIRDRFDEVFGPMGVGWRIRPSEGAGRVEHKTEERTKDKVTKTWHIVTLVAHTFEYSVILPDGSLTWVAASTTSDQSDNMDEQYAYRGVFTSMMKQFYRLLGGMNHVIYGEYTHIHAAKDLARQQRSA